MKPIDIETLGARIAERQDELLDGQGADPHLRRHLAELASGTEQPRPTARSWLLPSVAAAALLLLAAGVAAWKSRGEPSALTFSVGEPAKAGVLGELSSAHAGRLPIRFSEGTSLLLEPEARARVVAVGPHGAEIVVEAGRVNVAVVPRSGGDWTVRTGPFTVRVKGTQFDVGYDAAADRFALRLYHGRVAVSGCGFQDRAVQAGEQMTAACSRHEMSVAPLDAPVAAAPAAAAAAASAPAATLPAVPAAPAVSVAGRSSTSLAAQAPGVATSAHPQTAPAASGRSWVELARAGKYGEAFELLRDGFAAECAGADAERGLLLGETARLSGHPAEARRAYSTLRDRFGGSAQAAQAAFGLGRLALDAGADRAAAEHWFNAYLQEAPQGALASAALSRLLELRLDAGDRSGAARLAREYLERYPSGPRAAAARQVLDASLDEGHDRR